MRIRKLLCILLIALLGVGFYASGAAARTSCNDHSCFKSGLAPVHSHDQKMVLAPDCCPQHQKMPCELERRHSDEMSAFCVSAFRLVNYRSFVFINSMDDSLLSFSAGMEFAQRTTSQVTARSSPIYLKNLTLIC